MFPVLPREGGFIKRNFMMVIPLDYFCGSLYLTKGPAWITGTAIVSSGKILLEVVFFMTYFKLRTNYRWFCSAYAHLKWFESLSLLLPPSEKRIL